MFRAGVLALAAGVLLVGVGVVFVPNEAVRLVPDKESGDRVLAYWLDELANGVREQPELRFANPSREEFMKRLDAAAERYDFEVQRLEFRRPLQLAPLVIVRSADPYTLTKHVPAVARSLDPKADTGDDRTGWAWEGFYFEVRDYTDKPALVVLNHWRRGGGGQWAAEESLYPFEYTPPFSAR